MDNNLLTRDGEVFYYAEYYKPEESELIFDRLVKEIPWQQTPIMMFGKAVLQPRLTAWYGDENTAYRYSGVTMQPLAWTKTLEIIKDKLNNEFGFEFNSCLLNFYRHGQDSMGWHRDNEKELGQNPVIASLSFGAERVFKFRHISEDLKVSVTLENGSLLLMKGETQHHWQHSISKVTKVIGPRINLTFRNIKLPSTRQ